MGMSMYMSLVILGAAMLLPHTAHGEDARSILQTMRAKQVERWEGVNLYLVEQTLMGQPSQTYFQRAEVEDDTGDTQTLFLPVGPSTLVDGRCSEARRMTPEELRAFAAGAEMSGAGTSKEVERGMAQAGLPPGLLAAGGSNPSTPFDPRVMLGANAEFLRAAADAEDAAGETGADADEIADHMARFVATARLEGTETVNDRRAYLIRATDLNSVQPIDGGEFVMQKVSMWIDTEHYVPLVTRMEGEMTTDGETREVTIEKHDSDYRTVPGSALYEPYAQILKMSGMMDAAQEAEMREAQARIAEMEKQLAGMPAGQRAMMENMMGPQLKMMRNMAAGGGFQMEITVDRITVNPEGRGAGGQACAPGPMTTAAAPLPATAAAPAASPAANPGGATPAPARSPMELEQARQACLQEKIAAAQEAQQKKRGLGRLVSGIGRVADRFGGNFGREMAEVNRDVYDVNATAADLSQAAKDLGLTEDDIEACRNP